MSRVYNTEGGEYEDIDNVSEYESDMEVGAAISACYIASVEEVYFSRCKEDNMAVTWNEIVRAGAKDSEYLVVWSSRPVSPKARDTSTPSVPRKVRWPS